MSRSSSVFRNLGWLLAGAGLLVALQTATASRGHKIGDAPAKSPGDSLRVADVALSVPTSDEVRELRGALLELEGRVRALSPRSPPDVTATSARPVDVTERSGVDSRSAEERRRAILTELDVVLESEPTSDADTRAYAETSRGQLVNDALGARVVELRCTASFCKAVLEEQLGQSPQLDIAALIERTPFLAQEAMFAYESSASVRRTSIYAARPGMRLPHPGDEHG